MSVHKTTLLLTGWLLIRTATCARAREVLETHKETENWKKALGTEDNLLSISIVIQKLIRTVIEIQLIGSIRALTLSEFPRM